MQNLKLILTTTAIVIAVVAAFALRENNVKNVALQSYHLDGTNYKSAGTIGIDYRCTESPDTCTWILANGSYQPCHRGKYMAAP
jgi:hypothetical protein